MCLVLCFSLSLGFARALLCFAAALVVKGTLLAAVAGFGAFLAWRAYRTPRSVRPGINAPFAADGDGSAFLERFEVESREIFAKSAKVIELLQIKPGARVADLGAGTGLFLEQLAMAVTGSHLHHGGTDIDARGAVFLLDPYPKFVTHMRKRRTLLARSPTEMHAALARVFIGQNSYFSMDAPTGKHVIDTDVETEPDRNEEDIERDAPATNIEDGSLDLVLTTDSYQSVGRHTRTAAQSLRSLAAIFCR